MNAVEAVRKWADTNNLGRWVSPDQIRQIIEGTENADQWQSDEELAFLRDVVTDGIRREKVDKVRTAMDTITTLLNSNDANTLLDGMKGQHPYLLNDLIWALLKATKEQCGRGGNWDGRISPALQRFIDEFVV